MDDYIQNLKKAYVKYLTENASTVAQAETWLRTLSYLVAGRISKSHSTVIAELFYSSANLLTLLNDHLLSLHHKLYQEDEAGKRRLRMMVTSVECVEVFIEIAARKYATPTVRWILILAVQLIKTIGRFILLLRHDTGLRFSPLVRRLNREALNAGEQTEPEDSGPLYVSMPNSGRKIKSLSTKHKQGAAPIKQTSKPSALTREQLFAECVHNLQPLIHLAVQGIYGRKSWIPWLASLATDVFSLSKLRDGKYTYSKAEQSELSRRNVMLLMYLVRSPFYDKYTKLKIVRMLQAISVIPGASYLTDSLINYLPEWQDTYFYTWTS